MTKGLWDKMAMLASSVAILTNHSEKPSLRMDLANGMATHSLSYVNFRSHHSLFLLVWYLSYAYINKSQAEAIFNASRNC